MGFGEEDYRGQVSLSLYDVNSAYTIDTTSHIDTVFLLSRLLPKNT